MTTKPTRPANCDAPDPTVLTKDAALEQLLTSLPSIIETEEIGILDSLGRVIAEDISSPIDVPGHDNSAMDGYLVRAADTSENGATLQVTQRIAAGSTGNAIIPGCAARIFTGAPIAEQGDAVIMQEECERDGDKLIISRRVKPGENIRLKGNDVKAGDRLLSAGTRIAPQHMAVIASAGQPTVAVYRKLRVAILYTGDELVEPGQALPPGKIYNSNRYALTGLVQSLHCDLSLVKHVPDDFAATQAALLEAADQVDLIISTGGVSVGGEDHIKPALESVGSLSLWKIAMKPGKPLAYGKLKSAVFLGLPGNPVSTYVTFLLFVRPTIFKMQHADPAAPAYQEVPAGFSWTKKGSRREYVRAKLETNKDGQSRAILFSRQGSDVNSALTWANGLVEIPEFTTVEPGEIVRYYSFNEFLGLQ